MSDVYVLIAEAVYDQGIYGVFSNEEAAVTHGESLYDDSDGHHSFRVERWAVGQAREADRTIYWVADPQGRKASQTRRERLNSEHGRPPVPVINGGTT